MNDMARFDLPIHQNPLRTRRDVEQALLQLMEPVKGRFTAGNAGLKLGTYAAHYGEASARMEAFSRMLDRVAEVLGPDRAGTFHSHFSHIEFTPKGGEKCHRTFADNGGYGPDPAPLMAEVARRGWSPTFICESAGTQAEDALTMKKLYADCL